ncbi:MAG TPA: phosphodiester glycosidase family protein [Bacteroidales bacterium]|nr:phosphodiester glycosidase family protein [Bacteroidales bacterium]
MNIKTFVTASVAELLFFGTLCAQPAWINADSIFGPLPPSMHVYYTSDNLEGKPGIAYYVKVPLRDPELIFDVDTALNRGLTPSVYYERNGNPLLVINCTFFSPERRNVNVVIDEGEMVSFNIPSVFSKEDSLYHYVTRSAIGIDRHRNADVAWTFTDIERKRAYEMIYGPSVGAGEKADPVPGELKPEGSSYKGRLYRPWKMETAVGGGPSLLTNGEINITNNQERMFAGKAIGDRHPRTAMGYTLDGYLIIMAIEGRNPGRAEGATLIHEAELLRSLGCVEALNLDGGGSTCMLINGKETIKPSDATGQRRVPAVFMIKKAK